MPDAQAFESARQAYAETWTSAQAISAALAKGLRTAEGQGNDAMTAAILTEDFDPKGWLSATSEVDEALNRMAEGPRLADLWNVERKLAAVYAAWLELRRCNLEHNTIMLQTWTTATEAFAKALSVRPETEEPLESGRELMALWVDTANDVLLETQRSDAFLKSQRATLKASTDLRLAQRSIAEFYAEMFGYPTRAELDDVHKVSPSYVGKCGPKGVVARASPNERPIHMSNSSAVRIKLADAIAEAAALGPARRERRDVVRGGEGRRRSDCDDTKG